MMASNNPTSVKRLAEILHFLRCPACKHDDLKLDEGALRCAACHTAFSWRQGYLDFVAEQPATLSFSQRLMESARIAGVYEDYWRPWLLRRFVDLDFASECTMLRRFLGAEKAEPLLDLSCGPALHARALAKGTKFTPLFGLDLSRPMLEEGAKKAAEERLRRIYLFRGDAHNLPFRKERFAGVVNSGALHLYGSPETVFKDIFRILRPGGVYVGNTFLVNKYRLLAETGRSFWQLLGIHQWREDELRDLLLHVGFADFERIILYPLILFRVIKPRAAAGEYDEAA